MCNNTSENKACAQGKINFYRNWKGHWSSQGWGHVSSNTCQWGSLPGKSPKDEERWQVDAQVIPRSYWNLEGPLEVPMVGDMNCSTPANEDPCQGRCPRLEAQAFWRNGKSAHANIDIDIYYDIIKDVYVPGEFKRPHMTVNTVSVEQHEDDYIRPNADSKTRPQIRSNEHLKCMYSECWEGIGEFKDFEYHIEFNTNKPRVQTPHKIAFFVLWTKEKRSDWESKAWLINLEVHRMVNQYSNNRRIQLIDKIM